MKGRLLAVVAHVHAVIGGRRVRWAGGRAQRAPTGDGRLRGRSLNPVQKMALPRAQACAAGDYSLRQPKRPIAVRPVGKRTIWSKSCDALREGPSAV